jgi:hypothetical protein
MIPTAGSGTTHDPPSCGSPEIDEILPRNTITCLLPGNVDMPYQTTRSGGIGYRALNLQAPDNSLKKFPRSADESDERSPIDITAL